MKRTPAAKREIEALHGLLQLLYIAASPHDGGDPAEIEAKAAKNMMCTSRLSLVKLAEIFAVLGGCALNLAPEAALVPWCRSKAEARA